MHARKGARRCLVYHDYYPTARGFVEVTGNGCAHPGLYLCNAGIAELIARFD